MSEAARALSLFIHISATVIWIGGILLNTLLLIPELERVLDGQPELHRVLHRLRRRFHPVANLALVALLVTGLLQMADDPHYEGMLQFSNRWSQVLLLKHVLLLLMAGAGFWLQFNVAPALERASMLLARGKGQPPQDWQRLRARERRLTRLMALLALLVLAASAWLAVI